MLIVCSETPESSWVNVANSRCGRARWFRLVEPRLFHGIQTSVINLALFSYWLVARRRQGNLGEPLHGPMGVA